MGPLVEVFPNVKCLHPFDYFRGLSNQSKGEFLGHFLRRHFVSLLKYRDAFVQIGPRFL